MVLMGVSIHENHCLSGSLSHVLCVEHNSTLFFQEIVSV